jgi:hypothetical protein
MKHNDWKTVFRNGRQRVFRSSMTLFQTIIEEKQNVLITKAPPGDASSLANLFGCGGDVRIITSIEDPVVIKKILTHLDDKNSPATTELLPDCRAPPSLPMSLFV